MQAHLQVSDPQARGIDSQLSGATLNSHEGLHKSPGAIIVGGAHGSLAIARSLGRHGIPVWLFTNDHPIARFSRYVRCGPNWPVESGRKIEVLLDTAAKYGLRGWTLFPGSDNEAQFVARHHSILSGIFLMTAPAWNVMQWAYDKRLTYRLAAEVGVDLPWTFSPRDPDDVAAIGGPFPMVVKPAIKQEYKSRLVLDKAWRVDNREELLSRYDQACSLMDPSTIILQEFIPGSGGTQFSYAALWGKRGPVASLVARRSRQYPIDFGYTSTFVETMEMPEISRAAERLLRAMNYTGLVEVEFKYDVREQRYKLLDVNGRIWAWSALGRRAGVDFPYLMWLQSQGKPVPTCRGRTGVAWLHPSRDLIAAVLEIRRGTLSAGAYLRSLRGHKELAVFAVDDLLPAILQLPIFAVKLIQRLRR